MGKNKKSGKNTNSSTTQPIPQSQPIQPISIPEPQPIQSIPLQLSINYSQVEMNSLILENKFLREQLGIFQTKYFNELEHKNNIIKEFEELKKENIELKQRLNNTEHKLNNTEHKLNNTENKIINMDKEIIELKKDKVELKQQLNNTEHKLNTAENKIINMDKEIIELKKDNIEINRRQHKKDMHNSYNKIITAIQDLNSNQQLEKTTPKIPCLTNLRNNRNDINHYLYNNEPQNTSNYKIYILFQKLKDLNKELKDKLNNNYPALVEYLITYILNNDSIITYKDIFTQNEKDAIDIFWDLDC
jgi:chromosome segregation ATPase